MRRDKGDGKFMSKVIQRIPGGTHHVVSKKEMIHWHSLLIVETLLSTNRLDSESYFLAMSGLKLLGVRYSTDRDLPYC
jgi:hypothetical protein